MRARSAVLTYQDVNISSNKVSTRGFKIRWTVITIKQFMKCWKEIVVLARSNFRAPE